MSNRCTTTPVVSFSYKNAPNRHKFGKLGHQLCKTGPLIKLRENRRIQDHYLEMNVLLYVKKTLETSVREIVGNVNLAINPFITS